MLRREERDGGQTQQTNEEPRNLLRRKKENITLENRQNYGEKILESTEGTDRPNG